MARNHEDMASDPSFRPGRPQPATSNVEIPDHDLRYPIGQFEHVDELAPEQRMRKIAHIKSAPLRLEQALQDLHDLQLDTAYRPARSTVRQVVHHLPDSHLNGYLRMKWALTEDQPTIKPYDQDAWSALPDATRGSIDMSLALLDAVHRRWAHLLGRMTPDQFQRQFDHPESGTMTLDCLLAEYAWHGRHHIAQITALRDRRGW